MKKLFLIFAILLMGSSAWAQDDNIRVETNLVTLNVSVTKQGKFVPGLKQSDFNVFDNGQKQQIDTFSAENAPVSFGIVYDMHPATDEQAASVLDALRTFTKGLPTADDFFVSVFNEKGTLTAEFVPSVEQVSRQIEGGPNSLYDAIFAASDRMLKVRNHKRVLLVLTDGADHNSLHSFKELKAKLGSLNLPVYSITFGGRDRRLYSYSDIFRNGQRQTFGIGEERALDTAAMGEISKASGGQSFEAGMRNRIYLPALFDKVRDEVKYEYVIGFYPEKTDGKWHKLSITIADQKVNKLKTSYRKSYLSPGGTRKRG